MTPGTTVYSKMLLKNTYMPVDRTYVPVPQVWSVMFVRALTGVRSDFRFLRRFLSSKHIFKILQHDVEKKNDQPSPASVRKSQAD